MFIPCLSTSIHRVGGMRAAVEASNTVGCRLSLMFSGIDDDDAEKTIHVWFDGPDARERAAAYAAAINAANENTSLDDVDRAVAAVAAEIGASA